MAAEVLIFCFSLGLDVKVLDENQNEIDIMETIDYGDTDMRAEMEGGHRGSYNEEDSLGSMGYQKQEFDEDSEELINVDDEADDDRLEEPEILVTYEAWIESVDQLFNNERVTDEELLEDDKEDGMWQVEIMAHLVADNGTYFTREELLFKLHNLMANKELGDHVFFEGIEYEGHECEGYGLIDNEDGIPVFYTCCGS